MFRKLLDRESARHDTFTGEETFRRYTTMKQIAILFSSAYIETSFMSHEPSLPRIDDEDMVPLTTSIDISEDNSLIVQLIQGGKFVIRKTFDSNSNFTPQMSYNLPAIMEGTIRENDERIRDSFQTCLWQRGGNDMLTTSAENCHLKILDLRNGSPRTIETSKNKYRLHDVCDKNPAIIAAACNTEKSSEGTIDIFDIRTGLEVPRFKIRSQKNQNPVEHAIKLRWRPNEIRIGSINVSGKSSGRRHSVQEWDIRMAGCTPVIRYTDTPSEHEQKSSDGGVEFSSIKYSADGLDLYYLNNKYFTKFDTTNGKEIGRTPTQFNSFTCTLDFAITNGSNPEIAIIPHGFCLKAINLRSFEWVGHIGGNESLANVVNVAIDHKRQIVYSCTEGIGIFGSLPLSSVGFPLGMEFV